MAVFKFVVSSKDGKAYQTEKDQNACSSLMGKTIGSEFSGDLIGLNGYGLKITGGSDKEGFPMRKDIEGTMRKRFLISQGIGFKGTKKRGKVKVKLAGLRRKRTLRGNIIADDIVQINCSVTKDGSEPLEKLLGKKETTVVEEKKPEKVTKEVEIKTKR